MISKEEILGRGCFDRDYQNAREGELVNGWSAYSLTLFVE